MQILNATQALKEIKAEARKNGLTFGRMTTVGTINGSPAYKFYPRGGGDAVRSNLTLGTAYEIACSGELSQYSK
jgi:hypothetical protein